MAEEWRVVESHAEYMVSNEGRVIGKHGRFLKPYIRHNRYTVRLDGKQIALHKLVAETFLDNPDRLPVINHKDGNPKNNRSDNLEWCTQKQNIAHSRDILGNLNNISVLCVETGRVYDSCESAAMAVSGNKGAISRCVNGVRKTHKGFHWEKALQDGKPTKEEKIALYCQESMSSLKDESNFQFKEKNGFKKMLYLHGFNANTISNILGCTYPTASKKLNSPSDFKFLELVIISKKCQIPMQELLDSLMIDCLEVT